MSSTPKYAPGNTLSRNMKAAGLVSIGAIAGVMLSLNFSAVAERQSTMLNLPIEEVRMLSEVFGRIKSDYVEEVDDKRLIKEAINGMLTGLDPHSAFLDADAFKEMQTTTTGKFGGLGIEVGAEDGFVRVISPIDMVSLALQLGASFVARSFSGDKEQLVPLVKAALAHRGAAFIDVVSPCVAFNNHAGSTKSYDYVREHNAAVNRLDFMPKRDVITAQYAAGSVTEVTQHDGSVLRLRKIDQDYDASNRVAAMNYIGGHQAKGEVVTGLLYVEADAEDMHQHLNTVSRPFNQMSAVDLCPGASTLERINASLR